MRLIAGCLVLLSASLLVAQKVKEPGLSSKHAEVVGHRSASLNPAILAPGTRATANELAKIESQRTTARPQSQQRLPMSALPKNSTPAQNKNKPIRAVYKPPQSGTQSHQPYK